MIIVSVVIRITITGAISNIEIVIEMIISWTINGIILNAIRSVILSVA